MVRARDRVPALAVFLAVACAIPSRAPIEVDRPDEGVARTVASADVMREVETLVCMMTFELPQGSIEEPMFGVREHCKLPPAATPLERAVERAWTDARPMLASMRHEFVEPVRAALAEADPDARLAAVRRAYFSPRLLGLLIAHLEPALAQEGLRCVGCPPAFVPTPRTIEWAELTPYLAGYVWPEPVETPRDATGAPTGPPKYALKVCIGARGIEEIEDPDPALLELGFLATLHNGRLLDRAEQLYATLLEDPAFARLQDDFLRAHWLRTQLGPRLLGEAEVRRATCETVARFVADTGLSIAECAAWSKADPR